MQWSLSEEFEMTGSFIVWVRSRRRAGGRLCAASVLVGLGLGAVPAPAPAAVPDAPTRLLAIASDGSVRLAWFPPADDGGSTITGYRVRASSGALFTVPDSPATLGGLPNGVPVSFRVAAINADGQGPFSVSSNIVTPRPGTTIDTWAATGRLTTARGGGTAIRLAGGKVLVVGGTGSGFDAPPLASAEVYDVASGTWSATGVMGPRLGFTTTGLPDGRVLVTGGFSPTFAVLRSTRLYDPASGTWSVGAPLRRPRVNHTATLLADGRVLVAGGWTGSAATATAELYNPAANSWSPTGAMSVARFGHSATRRMDGRVLVAGGTAGSAGLRSTEVYVPSTRSWVTTSDLTTPRESDDICCKQAVLLASGKVLVAGGWNGSVLRTAEVYDPGTGAWTSTGSMRVGREAGFHLIRLPDGRVLALGGIDDYGPLKYAEVYNERTGTWHRVNDMTAARYAPAAVLIPGGRVLVAGGFRGLAALQSAEVFTAN